MQVSNASCMFIAAASSGVCATAGTAERARAAAGRHEERCGSPIIVYTRYEL
jgi:hypothetical protein